ncbi:hypothetical protein YC2023_008131 [Brassica napus]
MDGPEGAKIPPLNIVSNTDVEIMMGNRTFLTDGVSEEQHLATINGVVDGNGDHIVPDIGNVNEVGPEWGEGDQYGSMDGFGDMNDSAVMHCNLIEFMGWKARSMWDISLVILLLGDLRLSQGHKLYRFFLGLRVYHHLLLQISHRWFDGNVSGATMGHGGTLDIAGEEDNNAKRGEKGNTDGPGGDH